MNRRSLLALAPCLATGHVGAGAQDFPARPMHLVVPGGAGSFPDQVARLLGDRLAVPWRQPVIVENRPGAGGIAAMTELLRAAPDGHTLGLATMSQLVFNPSLFRHLPYNPLRDLAPIGTLLSGALVIVTHPSLPVRSLHELIALARRDRGRLDFAIPANGSPPHVVLALLMEATRSSFNIVPFRTGAEAAVQVVRGEVPLFIDAPPVVMLLVQAGRLRALAVTGPRRLALLPTVPTVEEEGYAGFRGETWMGLVARREVPSEVVAHIARDLAQVLGTDVALRNYLEAAGAQPMIETPQGFAELLRAEQARWSALIKISGMTLD